MEIANVSDAEFKTLVIRMLRDLIGYGKCIREEMKATLSEIKKNPQGTNREGKEARVQSNNLAHKEEINIQPEQNEGTKMFLKNEERIRRFYDILKHANIQIRGMSAEEEEQEIEYLFEKTMKKSTPSLVKEIRHSSPGSTESPNKLDPKRAPPRHIIIKMPMVKIKERILKAAREKETVTYKAVPIRL